MVSTGDPTPTAATETSGGGARSGATGDLVVGTVFDRYTILEQVGAGGMGEVYAAYDSKLDRKIALKLLRRSSEELETRLVREAQAMARLAHPNVVSVFDTGHVDEKLYLAMEFVRGETLRKWQKAAPRSLAELLRVYTEAGHGLAAAHVAGLVHRDFKPDNVLVAEDGRIKVTDFGIARAQEEPTPRTDGASAVKLRSSRPPPSVDSHAATPSTGALESPVTQEGTLLGTPGYMAPEQLLCEAVDARTDQFAFCVSLYEALYGERPFGKATGAQAKPSFEQVAEATLLGKVNEPQKNATVPAHIRRVLLRGLAAERDARYPSMRELLAELARDPAKKRRKLTFAVAGAAAALALVAGGVVQYQRVLGGRALACRGADAELSPIWNEVTKPKLRQAFLATASPIAGDTWSRVERTVDAYAKGWIEMRTETCEATRLRGTQSDEAMNLRMVCLDRRKEGLKAYVDVIASPDKQVVENATKAALSLLPLDRCADLAALRMAVPPPEDPVVRTNVDALRPKVAELKALNDSGKYAAAIEHAAPAIEEAEALGYKPLEAELRFLLAKSYSDTRKTREALPEDRRALGVAVAAGHDLLAARASALLAYDLGRLAREEEAIGWAEHGKSILARVHGNPEIEGELELAIGVSTYLRDPREGLRHTERARELWEKALGEGRPELALLFGNLSATYVVAGEHRKSAEFAQLGVNHVEKTLGPHHPAIMRPLANLGLALHQLGLNDDAEQAMTRELNVPGNAGILRGIGLNVLSEIHRFRGSCSQALAESTEAESEIARDVGEHPTFTADALVMQVPALSALGRHTEAIATAQRAVAMREAHFDAKNPLRALPYITFGSALRAAGRPRDALGYHERALEILSASNLPYDAVDALSGLGHDRLDLGQFEEARSAFARCIEETEKVSGKEHPGLATLLTGLSRTELGLRRPAQALPHLERAVAIAEKAKLTPALFEARFVLARATWEAGGSREAARELALAAKAAADRAEGDQTKLKKQIEAWLAAHP